MKKHPQIIRLFIPLLAIAFCLVYCWWTILSTDTIAVRGHYIGLSGFGCIIMLLLSNQIWATIATGIYLILGTTNILSIMPPLSPSEFHIDGAGNQSVQLLFLILFLLYFLLNFYFLSDIYLHYEKSKK